MTVAVDVCKAAIKAAFEGVSQDVLDALPAATGFAYQAFVFAIVGAELIGREGWAWEHPVTDLPTFANRRGASLQESTTNLSFMRHEGDGVRLIQELSVAGRSGAPHALDLCAVGPAAYSAGDAFPWHLTRSVVECKNVGDGVQLGEAREVVGLSLEVGHVQIPLPTRTIVISAHHIAPNAKRLLDAWLVDNHRWAAPDQVSEWVPIVADRFCI